MASVGYSPRALAQLERLYRYISLAASPRIAEAFVTAIMDYCDGFSLFLLRGIARDDIRPGLRLVGYRRRVTIAFRVSDSDAVIVLDIFYGGQDVQSLLDDDAQENS